MEQKFMLALDKVLSEKIVKNERVLCQKAGIDQGGMNKYLKTMRYKLGKGEKPDKLKENLNLDIVSKLVEVMGGELIFPWDRAYSEEHVLIAQLKEEIERLKAENLELDRQLYACEKMRQKFEDMITQRLPSHSDIPAEIRQNKSSAS